MKFCIMCGGYYEQWETPKQLQVVNGERIVERTIRLLKENGCKDIVITSNNEAFDGLGVERLEHENSYRYENGKLNGYWLVTMRLEDWIEMYKDCEFLQAQYAEEFKKSFVQKTETLTKPLFKCDYEKNKDCPKTFCKYLGKGDCYCTTNRNYAKED